MGRAAKTYLQLIDEKKCHRTKAELEMRKESEEALLTKTKIEEFEEVAENIIAHKEFKRIVALLESIGKNDDLYAGAINRYCILKSEVTEFIERKRELSEELVEFRANFTGTKDLDYLKTITQISTQINTLDKQIQAKRSMMFTIEKDNLMTIAGALRSIPKTINKKEEGDDDLF